MSAEELTTDVVERKIAGKTYKVRRLPILRLLDVASKYVRREMQKDKEAGLIVDEPKAGDVEKRALKLLNENMPTGLAIELLEAGIDQDWAIDEAGELYQAGGIKELQEVFGIIAGKEQSPASAKSRPSRSGASGRRK